jgi:translocation and assembly module TamB
LSSQPLPPNHFRLPAPRRRRNWIRAIIIATAGLALVIAIFLVGLVALLHKPSFRAYLIRAAHDRVSAALGVQLQVRDFGVHLSSVNPSVDMYDVVISGAPPDGKATVGAPEPPLLRADRLAVTVRIDSFLRRKWYFSGLELNHPVVQIRVDGEGRINLPQPNTSSQTDLFDLGVRRAVIDNGQFIYNDRKSAIDADLRDVQLQAHFDPAETRYSGQLSYADGRLHVENLNPIVHGLNAKFEATRTEFKVDQATLTSGQSRIEFSATLNNYAQPRIEGLYQAMVDAGDLRRIVKDPSLPAGVISLTGALRYESDSSRSFLDSITLDGNLAAGALQVPTQDKTRITVSDLTARYAFAKGDLTVRDVRARVLGGRATGDLTVHDIAGAAESKAHAILQDIALTQVQGLVNSPLPRDVMLTGAANANVDASWRGPLNNVIAHTDATIRAAIRPIRNEGVEEIPLTGDVHAFYDARLSQISFERTNLQMPQTSLNLNGTVSRRSALDARLESNDLSELETLANVFYPMAPLDLGGAGSFVGSVRGTVDAPQIAGQLQAASLRVRGTVWRMLRTGVEASPSELILTNGAIQRADRGRLTFNIQAGLKDWEFLETSPMDIHVTASQLNAADLVKLSGRPLPVSGTLSGDISLHGTRLGPTGQGEIDLAGGVVYDEPVNSVTVHFQGTTDQLHGDLNLRAPAGAARGTFTYLPKQNGYDAQIQATGIRLEQLHAIRSRNIQLTGVIDLKANGQGTIENPRLQLSVSTPRLQIQDQVLNGLSLQASVADRVANVTLNSESKDIFLRGQGAVHLTGNYDIDATLDTSTIPLQPVIAAYMPAQANNVIGQTELHVRVSGPLKDVSLLDAHVTVPTLMVSYRNTVNLAAANPIQMDYDKGVLTVRPATLRGTGTDVQIQGSFPFAVGAVSDRVSAQPTIRAAGTVDLQIAQLFDPDIKTSGQLRLDIHGYEHDSKPGIEGQIEVVNASIAAADLPFGLQNANGLLNLTNDGIEIRQFRGNVGGGALTAQGRVAYRPAVQVNLAVAANRIQMQYPQGVREYVDANLVVTGTPQSGLVRGRVQLQDVSFSRDFDAAELLAVFSDEGAAPASALAKNVKLDVTVQSLSDLNLTTSKLSLQGAANLQLKGTAADPVLTGRLRLDNGDLIFRGNRYELQASTLEFINPVKTEPVLNVEVNSSVQSYDIHMRLRGPLELLRTTYTSEPPLPQADIINLLVFGKTTEAAAGGTPGNLGAESLIASTVTSEVTGRVEKVAGLSQFSVDPVLGGNQQNPGARITVQQRVSGNLFVTFAADATSTGREVVKLEYQMSPQVSVSGVRDQNGGFGFDVRVRRSW